MLIVRKKKGINKFDYKRNDSVEIACRVLAGEHGTGDIVEYITSDHLTWECR